MMTKNQMIHHNEQMDAARAEFDRLWRGRIRQAAIDLNINPKNTQAMLAVQHCCWIAFAESKGIRTK